eukprot:scaffold117062_cov56-Phaeocystis_antarctica.AAC.2
MTKVLQPVPSDHTARSRVRTKQGSPPQDNSHRRRDAVARCGRLRKAADVSDVNGYEQRFLPA